MMAMFRWLVNGIFAANILHESCVTHFQIPLHDEYKDKKFSCQKLSKKEFSVLNVFMYFYIASPCRDDKEI